MDNKNDKDNVETKKIRVGIDVENTGNCDGAEVVKLYISDLFSTLSKPVKELKGFKKVFLKKGEKKHIEFILSKSDFASYDPDLSKWTVEEGYYDIIIQSTDEEIDSRIYLSEKSPYSYGLNSTIKVLYENEELKRLVQRLWEKNSWDIGILESNYQYTSNKLLNEIMPDKEVDNNSVAEFIEAVSKVIKM